MAAIEKLSAVFLLLLIGALSVDGQTNCTSGSVCFPSGVVPDGITAVDEGYYCCLDKNTTRHTGTDNCTCQVDLQLDEKIKEKADETKDYGRMCNRMSDCDGVAAKLTANGRFTYCCHPDPTREVVPFKYVAFVDGDKIEYVMCRCGNYSAPVPTPDPTAYVVPQTGLHQSTGEVCSYDQGCSDRPSLRCSSPSVTLCCYGSRGMVTVFKDNRTHCTCTNDVFGEVCQQPIPLQNPCMAECGDNTDMSNKSMCTAGASNTRCCPDNMAIRAANHNGAFTSCTCSASGDRSCAVTVDCGVQRDCQGKDVNSDGVCSDGDVTVCCPEGHAVQSILEIVKRKGLPHGCTCSASGAKSCAVKLDCLTDCQGKDVNSDGVCSNGKGTTVCCAEGQAVQATYDVANNNFPNCTCSAYHQKSCDVSAATRFSQLSALLVTALLLSRQSWAW